MKKSNILAIATVLIALHVLAFIVFIGKKEHQPQRPEPAPASTAEQSSPIDIPKFEVAPLQLLPGKPTTEPMTIKDTVEPVAVKSMPPAQARETIAKPGNRSGYLRSDLPNRRTSKVYSKLVGDPYRGAIVVDARTGKILYEDHATAYAYPASVTKLMTLLIVLEQIEAGKIHLNDKVAITPEIAGIGGSGVYLDVRESGAFTADDMIKAMMIHSACDAAEALAVHVAGSTDAFIDMMNQKARELGMNSTTYHSPHGLPPGDGKQPDISTAYDTAILCLAVLRHPETLEYTSIKLTYLPLSPIRKEKFMLANRNALVGKDPYPGCDGLKTGYHKMGGYSLAATAMHGNDRVVAVVLGVPDRKTRNDTVKKLLDKGFELINQ